MIHLEDYLDTLEALPMEIQRQFTLMHELDALSQDIQEKMRQATKNFIANPPTKDDPRHTEYMENFIQLFSTVLKHGEEKVALATQTYDLVDRHIRRLDDDLTKFEERQLAMPPRIIHSWGPTGNNGDSGRARGGDGAEHGRRGRRAAAVNSHNDGMAAVTGSGRRKRAHKDVSPQLANVGKSATPGRGRRGNNGSVAMASGSGSDSGGGGSRSRTSANKASAAVAAAAAATNALEEIALPDFSEMPIDPNEPRYCYCGQVSYGEMVACDDENCEIEWFHLGCVDLRDPPKGQWFCRDCSNKHKRRRD